MDKAELLRCLEAETKLHYGKAQNPEYAAGLERGIELIGQLTEPQCLTIDDYSISAASNVGKNHMWIERPSGEGMSVDLDNLFAECF